MSPPSSQPPSSQPPAALIARPLPPGDRAGLARALERALLPADDVEEAGRLFWRFETFDGVPVGYGGLETFGSDALLRSLVVLPPLRGQGYGRGIVEAVEVEAMVRKCRDAWLITTAAADFFAHLGYAVCPRAEVPEAVRLSRQFADLCPADARAMRKPLR